MCLVFPPDLFLAAEGVAIAIANFECFGALPRLFLAAEGAAISMVKYRYDRRVGLKKPKSPGAKEYPRGIPEE